MNKKVPLPELQNRMARFRSEMDATNPDWKLAVFSVRLINIITGTMQDGMLLISTIKMRNTGSGQL